MIFAHPLYIFVPISTRATIIYLRLIMNDAFLRSQMDPFKQEEILLQPRCHACLVLLTFPHFCNDICSTYVLHCSPLTETVAAHVPYTRRFYVLKMYVAGSTLNLMQCDARFHCLFKTYSSVSSVFDT